MKEENFSYNEIVERLYKENYLYFYKIANSILKNDVDAKDAVNESFVKIYKYMEKISEMKCPEIIAYVVSIVKSISINIKKRQSKVALSEFSEEIIDHEVSSKGADVILQQMAESENLNTLLSELPIIEQNILELKIIDKLTFKEISCAVGLSEEAAKKRYQRTLKKLKERIDEEM